MELLEREKELSALRTLLAGARDGTGGLALVEAPAGQGKSALLRALKAEATGMRVLSATGAALERDFAFGVVRQLFEPELRAADPERRERLLAGSARFALEVFDGTDARDACHTRLHGIVWLAANLAAERPLAIVVDDAHWADPGSLRALGMLARRAEDLPVALIVAARPAADPLLEELAKGTVLSPAPLSPGAVGRLIGDADAAFVAAAAETTGGNPLLVRELRRTLADAGLTGRAEEADAVRRTVPPTITRMVAARLAALSDDATALARAAAVTATQAAALAGLDPDAATRAHGELADAGLLERDCLHFPHPMMREAALAGVVRGERSALHRRAARLLERAGAPADAVAAHYLAADPAQDPVAARVLAGAGERALAAGDAGAATDLLRRAVAEAPPTPELLLTLGVAEARLGLPEADDRLAAASAGEGPTAARAAQVRAGVLVQAGRARHAVAVLREGIERAPAALAAELEDDLLDALNYDPALAPERRALAARAAPRPAVLAFRAFDEAAAGAPAADVLALARRALADGSLLAREAIERPAAWYAIEALLAVEAADEARSAIERFADAARRVGSRRAAGTVALLRSRWEHEYGDLRAAEQAAREALELQAAWRTGGPSNPVRTSLASALLDAGDVDGAERALAGADTPEYGIPICGFHALRARILLHRGRPGEALEDVRTQLALEARRGWVQTFREYSRATLVTALGEAGEVEQALQAADEALARARRRGLAAGEARLLVARARLMISRNDELELLARAVAAARRSPSALVQAEALAALGSALRRAGRRAESREPLREARELAARTGARELERRAHDELMIAGARPQRVARAGVDGLTPAERRVSELAAAGRRNREIADELFVTPKTVEVHLGRAYAKLGIRGRSQLAAALTGARRSSGSPGPTRRAGGPRRPSASAGTRSPRP